LRHWRQRRRISQLDLATEAQISVKHLCFLKTGRSQPSRDMLLHLAEHLQDKIGTIAESFVMKGGRVYKY
jgi:transcriptional regulator with XRE-family HTH domain